MKQYISEIIKPKEIGKIFGAIFGALIYAIGLNIFINPAGLYTGGVMGISQLIRTLLIDYFNFPFKGFNLVGIIFYLINLPLFLVAFKTMGKIFFTKTMITVAAMSLFLTIIPVPNHLLLQEDIIASCIIGAIFCGVGIGITLMMGACSGGVDIIGIYLLKRKSNFSVGKANLLLNIMVYSICILLFDIGTVIYSIIVAAVISIAIDRVHTQNINVEVTIITKMNLLDFEHEFMNQFGRGITKWISRGAYTEEESEILYIVLSKYEVNSLKRLLNQHDPNAFIVVKEGVWVEGNYLKKL